MKNLYIILSLIAGVLTSYADTTVVSEADTRGLYNWSPAMTGCGAASHTFSYTYLRHDTINKTDSWIESTGCTQPYNYGNCDQTTSKTFPVASRTFTVSYSITKNVSHSLSVSCQGAVEAKIDNSSGVTQGQSFSYTTGAYNINVDGCRIKKGKILAKVPDVTMRVASSYEGRGVVRSGLFLAGGGAYTSAPCSHTGQTQKATSGTFNSTARFLDHVRTEDYGDQLTSTEKCEGQN